MVYKILQQAILKAIREFGVKLKLNDIQIFHPDNEQYGDYCSNIALKIKTELRPNELAEKIKTSLKKASLEKENIPFIDKINIVNNFINISIKNEWFVSQIDDLLKEGKNYGKSKTLKPKKIMVEFAHPNTHKAFHIGHLRNITNGETIVRILEWQGNKVIRANYQGDVGLHIAKTLYKLKVNPAGGGAGSSKLKVVGSLEDKIKFLGEYYVEGNKAYETDKEAKREILEINKKIYDQSDEGINKLWQETRQWSLDYFEKIYNRVYSTFDRYYFESEVYKAGREMVLKGVKKGIFAKSKGAIIFPGSKFGLHDRVFITKEGNPTYEAKDMALARLQFKEYKPDLIIHNVAPEQSAYFQVIFKALELLLPYTKDKEQHLAYGWVRLKTGKMSSRAGNIVPGEWLLDKAKAEIKKSFPAVDDKTAEIIAVGAVKYSFLKVNPSQEIAFDFEESISLQGNSGPYLQYTYARCHSIQDKLTDKTDKGSTLSRVEPLSSKESKILRWLYRFPEITKQAADKLGPNIICQYLYELCQRYNSLYNKERIIGNELRVKITAATAQIMENGLYLLGIKAPDKM